MHQAKMAIASVEDTNCPGELPYKNEGVLVGNFEKNP